MVSIHTAGLGLFGLRLGFKASVSNSTMDGSSFLYEFFKNKTFWIIYRPLCLDFYLKPFILQRLHPVKTGLCDYHSVVYSAPVKPGPLLNNIFWLWQLHHWFLKLRLHVMNPLAESIYEPFPLNRTEPWRCNSDILRMDNMAAAGSTSDLHLTSRRFNYNQRGEHNSLWHFHYLNSCKVKALGVMVDLHKFYNTHIHTHDLEEPFEDMRTSEMCSLPKHVLSLIVKSIHSMYKKTHSHTNVHVHTHTRTHTPAYKLPAKLISHALAPYPQSAWETHCLLEPL